jgi:sugar phosphate isomerase/epimerase
MWVASSALVGLSTASVYPEATEAAFEIAAALGYDGVEVMVGTDPASQDPRELDRLATRHRVRILSVHSPCLVITARVWTSDPWEKLRRAQAAAQQLGAQTVVLHPPFVWQRQYARAFRTGLEAMSGETDVRFAVENMFPLRVRGRQASAYDPSWDVADQGYQHYTLDVSHTAASRSGALEMMDVMGSRLAHIHIADGLGANRDEHLIPGRGTQPCAQVLERAAAGGFGGHVIVEVNTRKAASRADRETDLAEALAFCRLHLVTPAADRG